MKSVNVSSHLAEFAASEPDRAAVIVAANDRRLTFRELNEHSDAFAHGLVAAGIGRGTRVAVMVPPSLDFFTLVFALFKVAAVPVMIDPGMRRRNLAKCLAEAEPAAFIGIAKAHLARRLFGWAKGCITVNAGRSHFFCQHSTSSLRELGRGRGPFASPAVSADEMAAILFTSGSTGLAKGVVYTHGIFAAQVRMLKEIYGIEPGEVDLCTFPLFALFGPALGMTCIVPTMNFSRPATIDAAKTLAAIEKYKATNLFGSPAVIRRLGDWGGHYGDKLPTLRRAISAGAAATHEVVERFTQLTAAQVYTPYGATEALPVANIGSDDLLATKSLTESGHGICLGHPVLGVNVYVIPIDDYEVAVFEASKCVPPGQIGEFVVRGPIVTKSYWKRDEATAMAKMHDAVSGETLHRMGDVGYCDEQGRLWYCGRKSQRVTTDVGTLFTEQVEPIFNCVEFVFRTALVGVGHRPVICVETISIRNMPDINVKYRLPTYRWEDVEREMMQRASQFSATKSIQTFLLYPDGFPVDPRHNSKINREALAVWAAEQLQG